MVVYRAACPLAGTVCCVAEEQALHHSPTGTSTEILLVFFRQILIDYECFTLLQLYFVQTNHFPKLKEARFLHAASVSKPPSSTKIIVLRISVFY